jgi:NADH dehydrogenase FAD-containing subunit
VSVPQLDAKTQEPLKERSEIEIPVGLTVWAAGTCPQPFVGTLLDQLPVEAKNRDGRVKVDRWMRAPMHDADLLGSVFVLGDAAAHPCDEYSAMQVLPPTAQVAGQEGAYLGRTLSRGYNMSCAIPQIVTTSGKGTFHHDPMLANWLRLRGLQQAPPFHFLNLGVLAYIGSGEALSQIQLGEVPVLSQAGTAGLLLCRSVYLAKQVATRNRVLVLFDWVKANLFGRDLTRF